jgi:outer membrane PBP1 activator LpoA protein
MRFSGYIAVTVAAAALTSLPAAAQQPDPLGQALSFATPERMAQLTSELALSPEQEARLAQLSAAFSREHAAALAQAQAMVNELQRIQTRDGQVPPDSLIALSVQYAEPLAELLPATQEFLRQMNAILTPDQRAKFQQMLGPAALLGGAAVPNVP